MSWFEALILGLLQGLTEFLPVSSSGHLIIGKELFGITTENLAFEVIVHAATVLSTITVFRKEIVNLFMKFFQFRWNEETAYIFKIFISMLPIMVVGLFLKDYVEEAFGKGAFLVGSMLLVTAVLLTATHFVKFKQQKGITFLKAFIIGIAQAFAVMPGLSRSGATIATGLLVGVKKEVIAQFSFLMVLIPILGEAFLEIIGGELTFSASGISPVAMITGFLAAYIAGVLACKFMIVIVKRTKLIWFALYCTILGLVSIFFLS